MMVTILAFLLILSILVFVHELGHFWTARKAGMRVDEFGFGFPPRAWGKLEPVPGEEAESLITGYTFQAHDVGKFVLRSTTGVVKLTNGDEEAFKWGKFYQIPEELLGAEIVEIHHDSFIQGGTIYSVNWLPLGGFVRIKGENGGNREENDSFPSKSVTARVIVLAAGVIMNVLFAIVALSIGFMAGLPSEISDSAPDYYTYENQEVRINQLIADAPADKSGLEIGDAILSIDGQAFDTKAETVEYIQANTSENQEFNFLIKNSDGDEEEVVTSAAFVEDLDRAALGIGFTETAIASVPWYYAPWEGLRATLSLLWQILDAFGGIVKQLVTTGSAPADVSGPVGIAVLTGTVIDLGWVYVLYFTAMLSLNLALLNILPFPALDGGRIVFVLVEKLRGRKMKEQVEGWLNASGFMLLILAMILVTIRDVSKFGLLDWFRDLL